MLSTNHKENEEKTKIKKQETPEPSVEQKQIARNPPSDILTTTKSRKIWLQMKQLKLDLWSSWAEY